MKVFSIYDLKAQAFSQPFFMESVGLAIRAFTELLDDKATTVAKYPSDFTLFEIGEFDQRKGILTAHAHHVNLGLAASFVKPAGAEKIADRVLADMQKLKEEVH